MPPFQAYPYMPEARNFLLKRSPPEFYTFNLQLFEDCVEQMARARAAAIEKDRSYIKAPAVVDGLGELLPRRCGRFFQTAYEYERNYLFLDVLYDPINTREGHHLFLRSSIYFAFFGRLVPGATTEVPGGRSPQHPISNMDWERDGESSPNADFGPAPPQDPAAESPERK